MDLAYSVKEKIHQKNNRIDEVIYEYEESYQETVAHDLYAKKDDRSRVFKAKISREQYDNLAKNLDKPLSFDSFLHVMKPFMMGSYTSDEIQRAFELLDTDKSGTIDIDELGAFLPIINSHVTSDMLLRYVSLVDENFDHKLNINEFNDLLSRGIGRAIVCGHIY
ncbi:unnamed protein product [Didymodactylos carnosus]|uniref:EF-hand domain-containing protein n=1 Tax=Didymodactylos carnosus TaxID=1234261 RepID=A0A815XID5_9BILA|nr:unnamed protein product [Didymodactylos carnosus]CAF1557753.1 unnamed protein product [Didymodactylos carnosus]CAF4159432.1 unnamed protein product [Didymodactylos carnosus]CAF4419056.1 unnamed protein product [Didymodactylos carnosus]